MLGRNDFELGRNDLFPEPRAVVYCFRLNFNISKLLISLFITQKFPIKPVNSSHYH